MNAYSFASSLSIVLVFRLSSVGTLAFVFGHPVHFIDVKSISDLHIIDALRQKGVPVSASVSKLLCQSEIIFLFSDMM